jgi:hypothetical protein
MTNEFEHYERNSTIRSMRTIITRRTSTRKSWSMMMIANLKKMTNLMKKRKR